MSSNSRKVFCLILVFQILLCECLKAPDITKAKDALKKIKDQIKGLKDNTIVKNVITAGKIVGHSAIAIKNIVLLIQSLMGGPTESKELKFMREQFAIINTKLDALDQDFTDLRNHIDWTVMKVNIGSHEAAIRSIEMNKEAYLKAPPKVAKFFGKMFIDSYKRLYRQAALSLYKAMAEVLIFQENILMIARKQLKNYHAQIAQFSSYILRIIQRGIVIENMYLTMSDFPIMEEKNREEWAQRFKTLESVATRVDKEIQDAWSTQYKLDTDEIGVRNPQLSNKDMATKLHGFLSAKYPWRWFFVFVYTFTDNNDKDRYFENCDGHVKVNVGNKVIIVNSMAPGTSGHKSNPMTYFAKLRPYERDFSAKAQLAKIIYNRSPSGCHGYYFKGVFESKSQPSFWTPVNHFYSFRMRLHRAWHNPKQYEKFVLV